jgi:hypothetical protein
VKEGYEPVQVSLTIAATQITPWTAQLLKFGDQPRPLPPPPTQPVAKAIQGGLRRFVLELEVGPTLYHSLGGGADESCSTDITVAGTAHPSCPGRNFLSLGFLVSARLGYRVQSRISLEVTLGYLRLWHDLPRRLRVFDANGQAYDSVPSDSNSWALDQTRVSMPFAGIGASREFFQRTPLLLRLTSGIGRATVRTALNGSFIAESGDGPAPFAISVLEDSRTLWIPFIAPEIRIGRRFATSWVADVGLAAWLLWAPGYPRTTSMVPGTPPEERWVLRADGGDPVRLGIESALGASLIVVPSLSVRREF